MGLVMSDEIRELEILGLGLGFVEQEGAKRNKKKR